MVFFVYFRAEVALLFTAGVRIRLAPNTQFRPSKLTARWASSITASRQMDPLPMASLHRLDPFPGIGHSKRCPKLRRLRPPSD
jgi:hypothetical protein